MYILFVFVVKKNNFQEYYFNDFITGTVGQWKLRDL